MKEHDQDEIQSLLKEAFPRMDAKLRRDLWPAMSRKLEAKEPPVPWYDWALIAASGAILALFPSFVLLFAYHF